MKKVILIQISLIIILSNLVTALNVPVVGTDLHTRASEFNVPNAWTTFYLENAINSTEDIINFSVQVKTGGVGTPNFNVRCYDITGNSSTLRSKADTDIAIPSTAGDYTLGLNLSGCQIGDYIGWYFSSGEAFIGANTSSDYDGIKYYIGDCDPSCTTSDSANKKSLAIIGWVHQEVTPPLSSTTFNITAVDTWDNSTITNFSAIIPMTSEDYVNASSYSNLYGWNDIDRAFNSVWDNPSATCTDIAGCYVEMEYNNSVNSIKADIRLSLWVRANDYYYLTCYQGEGGSSVNIAYINESIVGSTGLQNLTYSIPDECINENILINLGYNGNPIETGFFEEQGIDLYNQSLFNDANTGIIETYLLSNDTSLYDIYVVSDFYFNRTYKDVNVSTTLNSELNQTLITVNFMYSSGNLLDFTDINFTDTNYSYYFNVTTGTLTFSPPAETLLYDVTSDSNIFDYFNYTFSFSALEESTYNLTVNETLNVITFLDEKYGTPINNATITVTFPSNATLELFTNATGQINFSYINDGTLEFGDYSYYFNKFGYYNISLSDTINSSTIPYTKTYNISKANLIINIYDRSTNALITATNVTISFLNLFNESTDTGQIIKENLTIVSGDYTLYASANGYQTGTRFITYTNQENLTVNFYLINTTLSNIGTIFVTTKDSFYRDITGATVDLLEYIPEELSFVSVAQCLTNINAECSFNVELGTKVYYIRATAYIDGQLYVAETDSQGEIFNVNNDIRNLIFFTRTDFTVSPTTNLIYDIDEDFTNNISSISIDFFTSDGNAIEVCIEYFQDIDNSWVSVTGDTYCLESSSATQNIGTAVTLNRSNKYKAEVYINEGYNNVLETFIYPSLSSASNIFDDNFKGALVILMWIFALAYSLHQKNMTLFFVLAIIISWLELAFFPLFTISVISVFKTVVSIIGIYISRKRQDSA